MRDWALKLEINLRVREVEINRKLRDLACR
jgi:hypothetical protein